MKDIKRIVLATDFSESAQQAQEYAQCLAGQLNASVDIVHVFDEQVLRNTVFTPNLLTTEEFWIKEYVVKAREKATTLLKETAARFGPNATSHFLEGTPHKKIVEFANGNPVDLLIVGSHGYRGLDRWLMGSVAEYVLRHVNCPIIIVKKK